MSSCCDRQVAGQGCPGGQGNGCGGQARRQPRELSPEERRAWLLAYKHHLEERLAEVDRQLEEAQA